MRLFHAKKSDGNHTGTQLGKGDIPKYGREMSNLGKGRRRGNRRGESGVSSFCPLLRLLEAGEGLAPGQHNRTNGISYYVDPEGPA